MSEVAEKAGEIAAEVVEESVDGVVEVMEVVRDNPRLLVLGFGIGAVVGAVGGYFVARKKLQSFYEDLATQEIADAKTFYAGVNKVDEDGVILTPQEVLTKLHGEDAINAVRTYRGEAPAETEEELIAEAKDEQGGPWDDEMDAQQLAKVEARLLAERTAADSSRIVKEEVVVREETHNVFEDPTFDLEEERKHRSSTRPYVISHDEYFNTELEHDNIALVYYEEDDTLVDERDTPINEVDKVVGDESLIRFGHGSKDKNVVYVRNEKDEVDYEITRSTGSYLVEVLGLTPDPNSLKHSNRDEVLNRRREFRRGLG